MDIIYILYAPPKRLYSPYIVIPDPHILSIVVRNRHLSRRHRMRLLVGRRSRDISGQVRNTAGANVGVELRGELEENDDGQRRVNVHLDSCEGSADGAGEVAAVEQSLLRSRVVVDGFPARVGL